MEKLKSICNAAVAGFFNFWVAIFLMIFYATACAIATFIENDYGTPTAKALVYGTSWFDLLHFLVALNLIGLFIIAKPWARKKWASLCFHSAIILIIIGAGITRYYGFEGSMHIREGEASNAITSSDEFITLGMKLDSEQKPQGVYFPATILPAKIDKFDKKVMINGEEVQIKFADYAPAKDETELDILSAEITYKGQSQITKAAKNAQAHAPFKLEDAIFVLQWGNITRNLPFAIHLRDFQLDRYAGSMSPSSYASEVSVIDPMNNKEFDTRIFMNNVLDYGGYRFFQSSYDPDEGGTILSVNRDPGKIPTYIGYFLLTLGLVWNFFTKNGRFYRLAMYLKAQNLAFIAALSFAIFSATPSFAKDSIKTSQNATQTEISSTKAIESNNQDSMQNTQIAQNEISEESIKDLLNALKGARAHADYFATLLIQDAGGRTKPLDTLAAEYIHKITKKDGFLGLSNSQILLGMLAYPQEFQRIKMIKINTPKLKDLLGISQKEKYASFLDLFQNNEYKLSNLLENANRKKPAERDQFDKDIIAVDERVNLAYTIYSAQALRIFPLLDPSKSSSANTEQDLALEELLKAVMAENLEKLAPSAEIPEEMKRAWFAPTDALSIFGKGALLIRMLIGTYFSALEAGLKSGDYTQANAAVDAIKALQARFGGDALISQSRIDLEIFLNHYNIFQNLTLPYILLGLVLFFAVLIKILRNKAHNSEKSKLKSAILWLITLCVIIHTLGLALRWYVGGHAPWSNAYESMIYIAWASAVAGIVVFRKSQLAMAVSSFLAGICLFVAHLGFMDPQIGNLVPVLKSYWLNIHVSIITASYGFLGLCFMIGAICLLLFCFRNPKRVQLDDSIQTLHVINEMAMILGLAFLSVGNFLGGVWANESWGRYWGWDAKETWALISIAVYTIVLHTRFLKVRKNDGSLAFNGDSPFVFATLSVVAFYSILMTYFGVNFYLSGLHSYAAGDPLPIPSFLYFFVAGTIILIALAWRKRDLSTPELPKL